jgi:hypothetical protein
MGSLGVSSGSGGHVSECSSQGNWKSHRPGKKRPGGAYQGGMQLMSFGGHEGGGYGGGYCQHDKKPDYKQKPGKKHGKKPGKKPGGFPGGFPSFPQY